MRAPESVRLLCTAVDLAGGRALVVGGAARDLVLGIEPKDWDVEVYGLPGYQLWHLLTTLFDGRVDVFGQSFSVIKVLGQEVDIDVSLPRWESKTAPGHRGFDISADPNMTVEEAARRRDFTINTMAWDPLTGELLDPFGGQQDLAQRILRHTSDQFAEDSLRVLRGAQFAARFDLTVAPETLRLCGMLPLEEPKERVFEEFRKLLLQGKTPSRGLGFLAHIGWIDCYFPELATLIGTPQDPQWHPEGDVWIHTLHCVDAFAQHRIGDDHEDLIVGLAVLCHDLGKPATTEFLEGRWRSRGHEEAGEEPTRSFLRRITTQDLAGDVVPLVTNHLKPVELYNAGVRRPAVRRLAMRVGRLDRLVRVALADQRGRPPIVVDEFPAGDWLLEVAGDEAIVASRPQPIVKGQHLIDALGQRPGPHFGPVLNACFEAQLDGLITTLDEGLALAAEHLEVCP